MSETDYASLDPTRHDGVPFMLDLIVPEDACWDPNIDDIASIFSFEPDYAGLSTKMRVLVPERA